MREITMRRANAARRACFWRSSRTARPCSPRKTCVTRSPRPTAMRGGQIATSTGLSVPDPTNVHELHRGGATGDVWASLVGQIERLVPRDVQAAQPIKATHRKVGPRDVYMVMGAPKNSKVAFRAKGQAELWDPWTGATRPLRVLGQTATGTEVELPLEDYEAQIVVFTPTAGRGSSQYSARVCRPAPEASVQEIALDGEWEFELKPTMDNRYGDFRLPATDTDDRPRSTHLPSRRRQRRRGGVARAGLRRQPLGAGDLRLWAAVLAAGTDAGRCGCGRVGCRVGETHPCESDRIGQRGRQDVTRGGPTVSPGVTAWKAIPVTRAIMA